MHQHFSQLFSHLDFGSFSRRIMFREILESKSNWNCKRNVILRSESPMEMTPLVIFLYNVTGFAESVICCSPEFLLTSRGQVTVDKAKRCTVEHEGHSHCSLVSYKQTSQWVLMGELLWQVIKWLIEKWELLTQSVGDPRFHTVGKNVGDPVFVLRLDQDHNPNVPQSVDRHLGVRRWYNALLLCTSFLL